MASTAGGMVLVRTVASIARPSARASNATAGAVDTRDNFDGNEQGVRWFVNVFTSRLGDVAH